VAVLRAWRASGAGLARFRCTGWLGGLRADVPEPPADRAGVSRPGGARRSQGRRRSSASGRARRSWAWQAMMIQVQRSAAAGSRILGSVQPRTCLSRRKVCFQVEPAQERLPQPVHVPGGSGGAGGPQPHGLGITVAGQVIHRQPDKRPFDDRQVTVVAEPGGAVGEPACTRSHAAATAIPYREVTVLVVICGAGHVAGSASASSQPCLRGRPFVPRRRGGAGSHITRSLRSRPSSSTGRSASR
jgi:hypothetical protein